jgi:hypothetical protein
MNVGHDFHGRSYLYTFQDTFMGATLTVGPISIPFAATASVEIGYQVDIPLQES